MLIKLLALLTRMFLNILLWFVKKFKWFLGPLKVPFFLIIHFLLWVIKKLGL